MTPPVVADGVMLITREVRLELIIVVQRVFEWVITSIEIT